MIDHVHSAGWNHDIGVSAIRARAVRVVPWIAALTLALLLPGAGFAQDSPRSDLRPMRITRIDGVTAAQEQEFKARIQRMHEFIGSLPDISRPTDPECSFVYSNIEARLNAVFRVVQAGSAINLSVTAPGRPCPRVGDVLVRLRVNDLRWIYQCSQDVGQFCRIPALGPGPAGFRQFVGRQTFYVWARSQEPLLLTVSKEAYLRTWEQDLRRRLAANDVEAQWGGEQLRRIAAALAALPADVGSSPACQQAPEAGKEWLPWDPGPNPCPPGTELGTPNPRVLQSTLSPVDVETIVLHAVTGRTVGVSAPAHQYMQQVLKNFDFEGLSRVLTR